ncbi:hypothetical protein D1Z98_01880 [Riemerella anatipestifer]|uniref:hypothetical protein n=1 Tax=Riemerella anatipestifer TaxID=34085 RepID=UPI00129DBA5A|nr:hypothetical protein [Riemerella anatipestifer]MRM93759.1 hypothetical protein [Riemerella anatipestifer]
MKAKEVENILAIEFIKRDIAFIKNLFDNKTALKKELKYNEKALNERLHESFNHFTEILQKTVDKYYFGFYEVKKYIKLDIDYLDETIEENSEVLRNIEKLIKFVE